MDELSCGTASPILTIGDVTGGTAVETVIYTLKAQLKQKYDLEIDLELGLIPLDKTSQHGEMVVHVLPSSFMCREVGATNASTSHGHMFNSRSRLIVMESNGSNKRRHSGAGAILDLPTVLPLLLINKYACTDSLHLV